MNPTTLKTGILAALLLLLIAGIPVHAQQAPEGNTAPTSSSSEAPGRSTSLGRQSTLAPFLDNRNNLVGFAVGVSESYSNQPAFGTGTFGGKSYATAVQPRLFGTVTRTRSQL